MGMKLTSLDLCEIADTLDKIEAMNLDVEVVKVRGHKVVVKRGDSQMDGTTYYVQGITDGELSGKVSG